MCLYVFVSFSMISSGHVQELRCCSIVSSWTDKKENIKLIHIHRLWYLHSTLMSVLCFSSDIY